MITEALNQEYFLVSYFSDTLNIKHESSVAFSQRVEGHGPGFMCF